ncbi:MAG TPA: response regulator [Stenomitos sp.]
MKILIVEDDSTTSAALAEALTTHHYTVNLAEDGQMGLELAARFEYDLVLLDVMIPKLDGISLCKQLRTQGYQSPILLLTAKDSATARVIGLDAGADDYVVKPFDPEELLARIRALLRRGKSLSASAMTWENLRFDPVNGAVTCGEKLLHFTPKEYCLLELFLRNPKRIFSRGAILDRLWDFAKSPGEETVSTHIKCLRQKLKKVGVADLIETVHGLGYRLRPPSEIPAAEVVTSAALPDQKRETARRKVSDRTAKIWEKFHDKLTAQLYVLQQASQALSTGNLTPELKQQAQQEAHKLAGSLGIFGLLEGSRIARELEDWFFPQTILDEEQAGHIAERVEQLRQVLQEKPDVEAKTAPATYTPLILIVDDDLMLAERVRIEAIAWGLRVEVATDLEVARQAIAQSPPDVILLDLNFPGFENGFTLLKELIERIPKIPVLALTGRGTLSDRLEVARLGGYVFLEKPLPTYEILKAVTDVLSQNQVQHHNRVLIVDDDAAVTEHLADLLEPLGVEVTRLNQPQQFWEVLTNTSPNLLLLDLEMPGFNGIELCQAVRSDRRWHQLPILFLSAHTQAADIDRAFTAGADDYLSKSLTEAELATRIIHRLKRVGFQPDHAGTDPTDD